ncbi:acyl-CoA thioesterase II [Cryptococcus sp. DSM 104549]
MANSPLSEHVAVTPHPSDALTFHSPRLWVPGGARGVFGGQILAQAISAATSTISPPLGLHSAHCYFLLPAQASPVIDYRVEKSSDGRSYSSRVVRAFQGGKVVFVLMASYTRPPTELPEDFGLVGEVGPTKNAHHSTAFSVDPSLGEGPRAVPSFQVPFPDNLLPWQECVDDAEFLQKWLDTHDEVGKREWERKFFQEYIRERRSSPVIISRARTKDDTMPNPDPNHPHPQVRMSWLQARVEQSRPNEETIKAMIAYMSDFQFIGAAARSVGLNQTSTPRLGMLASLDHAIHFFPFPKDLDFSLPILHVMESQAVDLATGRGIARGRVYSANGHLLATTGQEGVVRANVKGKKSSGVLEGGMDEADVKEKKAKAKL